MNPKFYFVKCLNINSTICERTAEEVSFKWSNHRISSTILKVRTTLVVSVTDSRSERVKIYSNQRCHDIYLLVLSKQMKSCHLFFQHYFLGLGLASVKNTIKAEANERAV